MSLSESVVWVMDIGNTRSKWAKVEEEALTERALCPTSALVSGDNLTSVLPIAPGDRVILSSVVPQATQGLMAYAQGQGFSLTVADLALIQQHSQGQLDLSRYAQTLGVDRAINLLGALQRGFLDTTLVCDFGTTVTLDVLSPEGVFLGGAIVPGVRLFGQTLVPQNAAQLYEVDPLTSPTQTPGLDTSQSLANGVYWGYQGMISAVLQALLSKSVPAHSSYQVLLTGGDALGVFQAYPGVWPPQTFVEPDLTLMGLLALV